MVKQNPLFPVKISSRILIWAVETNLVFAKQFHTSTHLHTTPPPHFYETRPPFSGHPPEVTYREGKAKDRLHPRGSALLQFGNSTRSAAHQ
jgi:hypothetical protein